MMEDRMMRLWARKEEIDTLYSWHRYTWKVVSQLKTSAAKHRPDVALSTRIEKLLGDLSSALDTCHSCPWPTPSPWKAAFQLSNELFLILFELTDDAEKAAASGSTGSSWNTSGRPTGAVRLS
jgi:hypothetical protein